MRITARIIKPRKHVAHDIYIKFSREDKEKIKNSVVRLRSNERESDNLRHWYKGTMRDSGTM